VADNPGVLENPCGVGDPSITRPDPRPCTPTMPMAIRPSAHPVPFVHCPASKACLHCVQPNFDPTIAPKRSTRDHQLPRPVTDWNRIAAFGSPANCFTELQFAHSADDLGEGKTGRQSSAQAGLHRAGIDQHRVAQAVVTPYGGLIDDVIGGSSQKVFFQ
jgi:hypothetical protein